MVGGETSVLLSSPAGGAPTYVLLDSATGMMPIGPFGVSQLAFSAGLLALADFTGTFGPGLAPPITDAMGSWRVDLLVPDDPFLAGLVFYAEGYVLDVLPPLPPNGLFWQSDLVTVTLQ